MPIWAIICVSLKIRGEMMRIFLYKIAKLKRLNKIQTEKNYLTSSKALILLFWPSETKIQSKPFNDAMLQCIAYQNDVIAEAVFARLDIFVLNFFIRTDKTESKLYPSELKV